MDKIRELEATIVRLKSISVGLKVDLNVRDARIVELVAELKAAQDKIAKRDRETQTVRNLRVLGDSDDDDGFNPRQTGRFNSPWERAR